MWAPRLRPLLRYVTGRGGTTGAASVHNGAVLSSVSLHTGYRVPAVLRSRACVPQRVCRYSAVSWDQQTPSSDTDDSYSDGEEDRAETLPDFNIHVLVKLLHQENGKDLCVIRIPPELKYVEYFVIVGGTSARHLQALAQYVVKVYKALKKDTEPHVCIEGKDTDDWMCIDFGNIVVHFMLPETREVYELEKLWTLRSHDDQLSHMEPESLPADFTFGLPKQDGATV